MEIDLLRFERELISKGCRYIAGVDEVGRGPLAGDVVVCAVVMDLEHIVEGVNDSKKLTEKRREKLFPQIIEHAVCYSIIHKSPQIIDKINILQATKLAMEEAVAGLKVPIDHVLVDALKLKLEVPYTSLIKGDANSYSIGAASILAKVVRDREMIALAQRYPEYGFDKNKGYGSAAHIAALKAYGPTEIHRRTFITHFVEVN